MKWIFGAVCLASWGCGSAADQAVTHTSMTTDSSLPGGWTRVNALDAPISVGLPPGWASKDLSTNQFLRQVNKSAQNDPRLKKFRGATERGVVNKQFKFILSDASGNYRASCVVLDVPVKPSQTLEQIAAQNAKGVGIGGVKVETKDETLPAGPCIVDRYSAVSVQAKGPLDHINYMFLKNGHFYLLGFSIHPGDSKDARDQAGMAKTFTIGS